MSDRWKIDEELLTQTFCRLVSLSDESRRERAAADAVTATLKELGFSVEEDDAGQKIGGDTGNLYAYLPGTMPGKPVLFSAHLDTVKPGKGKRVILHSDGTITSAGDTVLGSDDLAAVAAILEGIRAILKAGIPHRAIEVVFSVAEELYCEGAKVFDFSRLKAKDAFVLDMSGAPGMAAIKAPSIISFEAEIIGKSAHAGSGAGNGIHAIQIMSEAIAKLPEGHLDEQSTFNIGSILGGEQTNIVPERCICRGEARSFSHGKAQKIIESVRKVFLDAAKARGATCHFESKVHIQAYETPQDSVCVQQFQEACKNVGLPGKLAQTFGGSDNNVFALHGIAGIVLSGGMHEVHSTKEYTSVRELAQDAQLVAQLCTIADRNA